MAEMHKTLFFAIILSFLCNQHYVHVHREIKNEAIHIILLRFRAQSIVNRIPIHLNFGRIIIIIISQMIQNPHSLL
jgi:hypothetical protein